MNRKVGSISRTLILSAFAAAITFTGSHCAVEGMTGFVVAGLLLFVALLSLIIFIVAVVSGGRALVFRRASWPSWLAAALSAFAALSGLKGPNGKAAYVHFESAVLADVESKHLKTLLLSSDNFTPEPRLTGPEWMLYGKADGPFRKMAVVCQYTHRETWITVNCGYYDLYSLRLRKVETLIKSDLALATNESDSANVRRVVEVEPWLNLRP